MAHGFPVRSERNLDLGLRRSGATGNNLGTLLIDDTATDVRIRCPRCGAEQTVPRWTTRKASGRVRNEPVGGQWLPCHVCQDWSPLEAPPDAIQGD